MRQRAVEFLTADQSEPDGGDLLGNTAVPTPELAQLRTDVSAGDPPTFVGGAGRLCLSFS
jgi:hypothetical protein